jgi:hypothetical protein
VATGDLTNVEKVRAQGVAAGPTADGVLEDLITQASEYFRQETTWPYGMGSQAYTEKRDGSGGQQLYLANPVSTVSSLVVNAGRRSPRRR